MGSLCYTIAQVRQLARSRTEGGRTLPCSYLGWVEVSTWNGLRAEFVDLGVNYMEMAAA